MYEQASTSDTLWPTHGVLLQPGDKVVAVLGLLETSKRHLGSRDVLFGVLEVFEQRLGVPVHTLGLVSRRVRVAVDLTALATEQAL